LSPLESETNKARTLHLIVEDILLICQNFGRNESISPKTQKDFPKHEFLKVSSSFVVLRVLEYSKLEQKPQ
jgi:hypothetical protein